MDNTKEKPYRIVVLGGDLCIIFQKIVTGKSWLIKRFIDDNYEYGEIMRVTYFGESYFTYIQYAESFLLVYAITSDETFRRIQEIYEEIRRVKNKELNRIVIVLAGNQCDLVEQRVVSKEQGQALAEQWTKEGVTTVFFETSGKERINNRECFFEIVRQLRKKREENKDEEDEFEEIVEKPKKRSKWTKWWERTNEKVTKALTKKEENDENDEQKKVDEDVNEKEEKKKWMKWWKDRNEKEKQEMIEKFEQLSRHDFGKWLLNQSEWKYVVKNENIPAICFAIDAYIHFHSDDVLKNQKEEKEEKEEKEVWNAYVIVDERKKLIKLNVVTFEELFRQVHNCLEWKDVQKMINENLKLEFANMKDSIIESDEAVMKEFESKEPIFKIILTPFQQPIILGKTKTIKNALVIMIAISEYDDNSKWKNLKNVKEKDITNFKQLFEQELNYKIVCNPSPKMAKGDVQDFMDQLVIDFKLRKNAYDYDGLIMIICGHGENENMLVASDGKYISIDEMRTSFNCYKMESFKDLPKIFIIDACRGENIPKAHEIVKRGNDTSYGHNDDGFLTIWSTTKGHQVADLSLLSECMKNIITSKYKSGYPFKQMLQEIRTKIRDNKSSEWYCVESQDTTDYDIIFQQRKSV
ncbi:ras-related protein Rap-1A [Reticulomyxa filosa]|uniref:small monomeric GTPase n=1 Tax=Reticulomyxa filosa TaxID=46433 RepID=X6LLZ1_RETFI|nr:ras-related protein Rap-1A [Reticulomyxa filosa]|eukprot:ETO01755.1 ras-related protein Rap-1A [Reticulomyxa filosa]